MCEYIISEEIQCRETNIQTSKGRHLQKATAVSVISKYNTGRQDCAVKILTPIDISSTKE